jgi:SAM-dependent methyltransferase
LGGQGYRSPVTGSIPQGAGFRDVAPLSVEVLRSTFDQVPQQYDRARPGYPPDVFSDLANLAQLRDGTRVVEIGCGTGQATVTLAQMGYAVTCVELGAQLVAAYAHRTLAAYPSVEVINAEFESWLPERADFDAVIAFSAFHWTWIAPDVRYAKSADLLGATGKLAFVSTAHVLPADGDRFFVDVQRDYEQVVPDDPQTKSDASGPPGTRQPLLDRIRRRIETRPDGQVRKSYLALLYVAERF